MKPKIIERVITGFWDGQPIWRPMTSKEKLDKFIKNS
jgi:hypothetical protein